MELVGTGGKVVLRVSDDGVGFDLNASQHQTGLGMTSMSERIRFVGGPYRYGQDRRWAHKLRLQFHSLTGPWL